MSRQRSLESMAGEENRLLEAYRQEVITLAQLREHLKQVGARRHQLDLEAAPPKLLPLQNAKGWLRAYAAFVRKRKARLTFEIVKELKHGKALPSRITVHRSETRFKN